MFKFLLILFLILYVVYKIGGLFFKAGAAYQQFRTPPPRKDRNLREDDIPKKDKGKGTISGGEYIDYEEVKK